MIRAKLRGKPNRPERHTLFILDTFAEARTRGLLAGFVGTYADLRELIHNDIEAEGVQQ